MKCMSSQMLFAISGHDHFTKNNDLPMPLQFLVCTVTNNFGPLFIKHVLAVAGISHFEFSSAMLNLSVKI